MIQKSIDVQSLTSEPSSNDSVKLNSTRPLFLIYNVHYCLLIFAHFTVTSPALSTGMQFGKVKVTFKSRSTCVVPTMFPSRQFQHHVAFICFKTFMLKCVRCLRATCCKDPLHLCKIEKIDFLKICQEEGFY